MEKQARLLKEQKMQLSLKIRANEIEIAEINSRNEQLNLDRIALNKTVSNLRSEGRQLTTRNKNYESEIQHLLSRMGMIEQQNSNLHYALTDALLDTSKIVSNQCYDSSIHMQSTAERMHPANVSDDEEKMKQSAWHSISVINNANDNRVIEFPHSTKAHGNTHERNNTKTIIMPDKDTVTFSQTHSPSFSNLSHVSMFDGMYDFDLQCTLFAHALN